MNTVPVRLCRVSLLLLVSMRRGETEISLELDGWSRRWAAASGLRLSLERMNPKIWQTLAIVQLWVAYEMLLQIGGVRKESVLMRVALAAFHQTRAYFEG